MASYTQPNIGSPQVQPVQADLSINHPTQPPNQSAHEFQSSRRIVRDIQRNTVLHEYIVDGTPDEAAISQATTNLRIGTVHPFEDHAFVVREEYTPWVMGGNTAQSKTLMEVTYTTRPCLAMYEESFDVALVSYECWWSYDTVPKNLTESAIGLTLLYPQIMYRRRYPNVRMHYSEVMNLYLLAGKTNGNGFLNQPVDFWLIDGIKANLLYGRTSDITNEPANWEISIVFRGDPWRRHKKWVAKAHNTVPDPPNNSFAALEAVHNTYRQFQLYEQGFDNLIDAGDKGTCTP